MLLVSSCLLGLNTKYNGKNNLRHEVCRLCSRVAVAPVCPEQLGGLPTPRPPYEIQGGDGLGVLDGRARVISQQGQDSTEAFLLGAKETLKLADTVTAVAALFKARSPSCGNCCIYDGTFSGCTHEGSGVTASLLLQQGIPVFNEDQVGELLLYLYDSKILVGKGGSHDVS